LRRRRRIAGRGVGRRTRLQLARSATPAAFTAALVVAGLVAAIVLVAALQVRLPGEERYVTQVAVRDAAGVVAQSASVRISGVPVGTVSAVDLREGEPVLTIELDGDRAPLYRDARARLRPGTPLNDMYLDVVDRGTPAAGTLGPAHVLPATRTSQAVDISRVLNVFDARVRPRVRAMIVELGKALEDDGEGLRRTLVELAPFLRSARRISEQVAIRSHEMRRLVHNWSAMSGELAGREAQLARLVRSSGETFDELGDRASPLSNLLVELPATLREVPPSFAELRDAAGHIDPALRALRPTARALPGSLGALESLAPDLESGTRELERAVGPVSNVLGPTKPLGDRLAVALTRLTPQLRRVDRVNQRAIPCKEELSAYLRYWLSVYKIHDDFTVLTHGLSHLGASAAAGSSEPALSEMDSCTQTGLAE
jgi:virulence factor Mce-like protein